MRFTSAPRPRIGLILRRASLLLALVVMAPGVARSQGTGETREFQKKAEFITSFTRFVEWPARKFVLPDSPFVIGVYGSDNMTGLLQEALQERRIKDRQVVVKHLQNKEELRACHVLFISRSERDRLGSILAEVRRENVLTVGESDNFLGKGGVINFVNIGGTVRFQISTEAAAREKLVISSKLLQLSVAASGSISTAPPATVKLAEGMRPVSAR